MCKQKFHVETTVDVSDKKTNIFLWILDFLSTLFFGKDGAFIHSEEDDE